MPLQEKKCSLEIAGATITYRIWRPGKHRRLLVLVHGVASNMSRWSEFIETTSLSKSWDILRLDLRGHGESVFRGAVNLREWSLDLGEILDAEKYQDCVIIGHSLGAQLAMYYATHYPSRVAGIALVDPVLHQALYAKPKNFYRARFLIWTIIGIVRFFNMLGFKRKKLPLRDLQQLDQETRKEIAKTGNMEEFVAKYSSPWPDLKQFPVSNYLKELLETLRPIPNITKIKVPVLALLAKVPTYTDPEITDKILAKIEKNETVHIQAYHWPLTEKPDETREAIERWCEKNF
jgi:esterase